MGGRGGEGRGERQWEREREKHLLFTYLCIYWLILVCALTRDQTHNLRVSEWCSNQLRYTARALRERLEGCVNCWHCEGGTGDRASISWFICGQPALTCVVREMRAETCWTLTVKAADKVGKMGWISRDKGPQASSEEAPQWDSVQSPNQSPQGNVTSPSLPLHAIVWLPIREGLQPSTLPSMAEPWKGSFCVVLLLRNKDEEGGGHHVISESQRCAPSTHPHPRSSWLKKTYTH